MFLSAVLLHQALAGQANERFLLSDSQVRQFASKIVRPAYPQDAARSHRVGVCVASVDIQSDGTVSGVKILQAPTVSIASTMLAAVRLWRFRALPEPNGTPQGATGKVIYYFLFVGGRPEVLAPAEAPVIAPR